MYNNNIDNNATVSMTVAKILIKYVCVTYILIKKSITTIIMKQTLVTAAIHNCHYYDHDTGDIKNSHASYTIRASYTVK